jgi:hypothetical protein
MLGVGGAPWNGTHRAPPKEADMQRLTRAELIDRLRAELLETCDDEHSMCEAATKRGIFCHGFSQWTFSELRRRFPTIVRSRPAITPAELKELANEWILARQAAQGLPLACDAQMHEGALRICKGWDQWSNADLARFLHELTGEEVEVKATA